MSNVVIITGASRGIGAATALYLGSKGYEVCVNYLNDEKAAATVCTKIIDAGGSAMKFRADVSQESDVQALFESAGEAFGEVTHLVNNVGVLYQQSEMVEMSAQRFIKVMQTNVLSAFLCSRELVRRSQSAAAIVNVSSAAAKSGAPFEYVDYAASKGAIDTLTKGMSLELAPKNIRVNGVRPGFIKTDIHAAGGEPDRVNRVSAQIPLQRVGEPEEVAAAIAWLLSDEASCVTDSFIDIAGGK